MCLLWFYVVWLHVSWLCELQVMIRQQAPSLGFSSPWPNTRSTSREHRQRLTPSWRAGTLRKLNGKVFGLHGDDLWLMLDWPIQWSKDRMFISLLTFSLWDKGRLLNRRLCPNLYSFIAKFSQFATHPWPPPISIHSVIDHMFSTNRGDLSKLEYLTQVIKEGMRLHCPVPFMQRQLTQPATIDGLFDLRRFLFVIFYLMTTWFSALFTRSHQWYEMSWFHLITSWYR